MWIMMMKVRHVHAHLSHGHNAWLLHNYAEALVYIASRVCLACVCVDWATSSLPGKACRGRELKRRGPEGARVGAGGSGLGTWHCFSSAENADRHNHIHSLAPVGIAIQQHHNPGKLVRMAIFRC